MNNLWAKIKDTKTLISIVSLLVLLLTTWGIKIPIEEVETTVQVLCTVGVMLGVLHDTGGIKKEPPTEEDTTDED